MSTNDGGRGSNQVTSSPHPAARALLTLMEEISEDHYCAGWMDGLEFRLWEIANGANPNYGMYPIEPERVASLKWLSEQAGGWWYWDDSKPMGEDAETFATMDEWLKIYEPNRRP